MRLSRNLWKVTCATLLFAWAGVAALRAQEGEWTYGEEYLESESESQEVQQTSAGEIVCRVVTRVYCRLACKMAQPGQTEECRKDCRDIIEKSCPGADTQE